MRSNMGMQVMDAGDSLETHQYTFGGIADTYKQFMYDICGAAEIPATRLFGRSPEGMNATGESDMQNYYEMIATKQDAILRPILEKLLPIIAMSVWGAVPDDLDFTFNSVRQPSDQERTELAKSGSDAIVSVFNAGLISPRTALRELKQQSVSTGIWTNISDDDIEKASDEVEQQPEMGDMGGLNGEGGINTPTEEEKTPQGNFGAEEGKAPVVEEDNPFNASANDAKRDSKGNLHGDKDGRFVSKKGGELTSKIDLSKLIENGNIKQTIRINYSFEKDIQLLNSNNTFILAGSKATGVVPIAYGREIRQVDRLCNLYNTSDPDEWRKVRCNADIKFPDGTVLNREIHYYFHPSVGEVEYKFPTNKKQVGRGGQKHEG